MQEDNYENEDNTKLSVKQNFNEVFPYKKNF